jgi:hypothetical protein
VRGNESWWNVNIAGVEFVAANLGYISERTLRDWKASGLTLQPKNLSWRWTEKSIGGRRAIRTGSLIARDTRYEFTPIINTSSLMAGTRLEAIPLDTGLECVMIKLDSDVMDTVLVRTHEKINRFTVGDKIREAIGKTVQELGSWMA